MSTYQETNSSAADRFHTILGHWQLVAYTFHFNQCVFLVNSYSPCEAHLKPIVCNFLNAFSGVRHILSWFPYKSEGHSSDIAYQYLLSNKSLVVLEMNDPPTNMVNGVSGLIQTSNKIFPLFCQNAVSHAVSYHLSYYPNFDNRDAQLVCTSNFEMEYGTP